MKSRPATRASSPSPHGRTCHTWAPCSTVEMPLPIPWMGPQKVQSYQILVVVMSVSSTCTKLLSTLFASLCASYCYAGAGKCISTTLTFWTSPVGSNLSVVRGSIVDVIVCCRSVMSVAREIDPFGDAAVKCCTAWECASTGIDGSKAS